MTSPKPDAAEELRRVYERRLAEKLAGEPVIKLLAEERLARIEKGLSK